MNDCLAQLPTFQFQFSAILSSVIFRSKAIFVQMAHYAWIVKAFSPRDGGWVRLLSSWPSETDAWQFVQMTWAMMVEAGDYESLDVCKTILFRPRFFVGRRNRL
jgi:hypothetical protein